MSRFFASPGKTSEADLVAEIDIVSKNEVVSGLLHSISGLLAILDENRQIIAVNNAFLQMLAIDDPENSLGLRPGEALGCVHAHEEPTGCGTTNLCSTCGAAIAIVSSLGQDRPVERTCALSAIRDGRAIEMALLVRSHPIRIEDKRFLLLFLQDITKQEQRAALERTFFHDISNMLSVIVGASEVLAKDVPSELADIILQMSLRLRKEVAIQRCLARNECSGYRPVWYAYTAEKIFEQLRTFFAHHQAATDKTINFRPPDPAISITTDISSLSRVLCNMIINALEATEKYGAVKVWIEIKNQSLTFCVWNSQAIPKDITNRVFQRNFSTKLGAGRGIGTYSMKLFGEEVLGGQVSFTSSEKEGTIFRFSCPLTPSFHKP